MFLDQLNARLAVKKAEQEYNATSPLERVAKAIQEDIVTSSSVLVQKNWATWDAYHNPKSSSGASPITESNLKDGIRHNDYNRRGYGNASLDHKEITKYRGNPLSSNQLANHAKAAETAKAVSDAHGAAHKYLTETTTPTMEGYAPFHQKIVSARTAHGKVSQYAPLN